MNSLVDMGADIEISGNYIEVRLNDGKWSAGQSFKSEATLNIPTADFGIRKSFYTDFNGNDLPEFDDSFNWLYPKLQNGFGASIYIVIGGSVDIEINYADFVDNLDSFMNERNES